MSRSVTPRHAWRPSPPQIIQPERGDHHGYAQIFRFLAILSLVAFSLAEIRPDQREPAETFIAITNHGRAALAQMGSTA
jgi:hypothetical protein